jgi:predicted nucleic acid-binding protein
MSRILLDTSTYSAYTGGHPDLQEPVRHASMVHLSVVAVGELLTGFLKGGRRRQNETRLREFAAEPRVRVLHVDDETAVRYAAIRDFLRGPTAGRGRLPAGPSPGCRPGSRLRPSGVRGKRPFLGPRVPIQSP